MHITWYRQHLASARCCSGNICEKKLESPHSVFVALTKSSTRLLSRWEMGTDSRRATSSSRGSAVIHWLNCRWFAIEAMSDFPCLDIEALDVLSMASVDLR